MTKAEKVKALKEVLALAEDNLRCLSQSPPALEQRKSNLRRMDEILEDLGLAGADMTELYVTLDDAVEE